jgi:hypothetical protein
MHLAAAHCRKQQAAQLEIAATNGLESRRTIALKAAAVWGTKADEAEKRDAGKQNPLDRLDAEITLEFAREDEEEALAEKEQDDLDG